jgi:hypothetical protein
MKCSVLGLINVNKTRIQALHPHERDLVPLVQEAGWVSGTENTTTLHYPGCERYTVHEK